MAQVTKVPCEKCGNIVARSSRLCPYCKSTGPNSGRNAFGCFIIAVVVFFWGANSLYEGARNALGLESSNTSAIATNDTSNAAIPYDDQLRREPQIEVNESPINRNETPAEVSVETDPSEIGRSTNRNDRRFVNDIVESPQYRDGFVDQSVGDWREVRRAVEKSFLSGDPARWKVGKIKGYAVPSAPSDNGCRMVRYSIDGRRVDEFKPVEMCPQ